MMTDFRTLDAGEPLQHAVALVLAGAQRDFPVTENGRLVGVLTRDALVKALATGHWWALARETAKDPMIWFFAGTSALYGVVGQAAEAASPAGRPRHRGDRRDVSGGRRCVGRRRPAGR